VSRERVPERPRNRGRLARRVDPEAERGFRPVEGERLAAEARDNDGEQHTGCCLHGSSRGAPRELGAERQQCKRAERSEQWAGDERDVPAWVAPGHRHPGRSEDGEDEREAERDIPEREERDDERNGEGGAGECEARRGGGDRQPRRAGRWG
jgi:hypothetical protein